MTPTFNTISLKEVVARAKMSLRIKDTSESDLFLEVLAREAIGSLNPLSQLIKKQCSLTVTGQSAELPKDFVRYLAFQVDIKNSTTDPITDQLLSGCQRMLYADSAFLENCGCNADGALGWRQGGFQIRDGFIHFNAANTIVSNTLAYMGLNVDDKGDPVIYERFERAISAYMCFKYTLAFVEDFNQYVIESYKREWTAQKSRMEGEDVVSQFRDNKREIQSIWTAMLVSKSVNYNIG